MLPNIIAHHQVKISFCVWKTISVARNEINLWVEIHGSRDSGHGIIQGREFGLRKLSTQGFSQMTSSTANVQNHWMIATINHRHACQMGGTVYPTQLKRRV